MSEAMIQRLTRVFKIGAVRLADPAPELSPQDAVALYQRAYPFVTGATLAQPVVDGETLVFEVVKRPVQTKGAE